jgi:hypothetical protein
MPKRETSRRASRLIADMSPERLATLVARVKPVALVSITLNAFKVPEHP